MKKILLIFTLLCAFTLSANAQEKKPAAVQKIDATVEAKKDAEDLTKLLNLNSTQSTDFYRLFEMKYKMLQENLSEDRKAILSQNIDAKIKASLTADQINTLVAKKDLYNRLIK